MSGTTWATPAGGRRCLLVPGTLTNCKCDQNISQIEWEQRNGRCTPPAETLLYWGCLRNCLSFPPGPPGDLAVRTWDLGKSDRVEEHLSNSANNDNNNNHDYEKKTSLSDLYVSIGLLIYANCSIITLCKPSKYFLLVNNRGSNAFTVCFVRSNKVWTHIKDAALQRILFPAGRLPLSVTPEEPGLWILQRTAEAPKTHRPNDAAFWELRTSLTCNWFLLLKIAGGGR